MQIYSEKNDCEEGIMGLHFYVKSSTKFARFADDIAFALFDP